MSNYNSEQFEQRELHQRAWRRVQAKLSFWLHLAFYLVVNLSLYLVVLRPPWYSGTFNWWVWPLAWAFGLMLHYLAVFVYSDRASTRRVRRPGIINRMIEQEMEKMEEPTPSVERQWPPMPDNGYGYRPANEPWSPDGR